MQEEEEDEEEEDDDEDAHDEDDDDDEQAKRRRRMRARRGSKCKEAAARTARTVATSAMYGCKHDGSMLLLPLAVFSLTCFQCWTATEGLQFRAVMAWRQWQSDSEDTRQLPLLTPHGRQPPKLSTRGRTTHTSQGSSFLPLVRAPWVGWKALEAEKMFKVRETRITGI